MINNKKIGIFGLGISGISSFNFLKTKTNKLICWDDAKVNQDKIDSQFLLPISDPEWQELDIIIVSPGIPSGHEIFSLASKYNIRIASDVELFLDVNHDSDIIVITGTNGKSTVTALIGHIIKQNNLNYHIGGNIGVPVLDLPHYAKGYVLELSSFQLDLLPSIDPKISVLLNLSPDHLDRHGSYKAYCAAKEKAFYGDGLKIIGTNSVDSKRLYNKLYNLGDKKLIPINIDHNNINHSNISHRQNFKGINCNSEHLTDSFFDFESYKLPLLSNLPGQHNLENVASAFAVCRAIGIQGKDILKHLSSFEGLKHRMQFIGRQFIGRQKYIAFYNDSKATNISSALSSLSALENIFWLAGGVFKEKTLEPIAESIHNINKAYLFGESKLLFAKYLEGKIDYSVHDNMKEAFNAAINDAQQAKSELINILLAPACSSFDQFKNFADRGNNFINLYNAQFK